MNVDVSTDIVINRTGPDASDYAANQTMPQCGTKKDLALLKRRLETESA